VPVKRPLTAPTRKPVVVSATSPNAGVRSWYQRQIDDLLGAMHLDICARLGEALNETPIEGLAADAKSPVSNIDRVLKAWSKKWTLRFDKLSLDLSRRFAAKSFSATQASMEAALKRAGFTIKFQPTKHALEAYKSVIAENINLIRSISEEYHRDVQTAVWTSVRAGGKMSTLSKNLHKTYGVSVKRAALIARDQNAKATATIENTRRQQLGIKQAIWQHSSAGKEPRPTHVAMNGKMYDLNKGMWDSDEKEFVLPGQLINCRCTSRAIIPGFED
jgi:SPP1 gp7 family putative phage head morphogenesis protein